MLTSHCLHCGAAKDPSNYAADFCGGCSTVRTETREFVTRENEERHKANDAILTPETKEKLRRAAEADMTGSAARELSASLGLKPLIDMSAALRDAMVKRAHHTNSGHADPRAVFHPGASDARVQNLGMGAKIPPGSVVRTNGA